MLAIVAGLLVRFAFYGELFGGGRRSNNNNQSALPILLAIMLVSAVVYAISFLLIRLLSRYREAGSGSFGCAAYRAAIGAEERAGQGQRCHGEDPGPGPAVGRAAERLLLRARAANAALRGGGPGEPANLAKLFSTHPSLERRIEELDKIQRQLGQIAPKN